MGSGRPWLRMGVSKRPTETRNMPRTTRVCWTRGDPAAPRERVLGRVGRARWRSWCDGTPGRSSNGPCEAELEVLLADCDAVRLPDGQTAVVRNGHLPKRTLLTGLGPVEVEVPKVQDRVGSGIKFHSILASYVRRPPILSISRCRPFLSLTVYVELGSWLHVGVACKEAACCSKRTPFCMGHRHSLTSAWTKTQNR